MNNKNKVLLFSGLVALILAGTAAGVLLPFGSARKKQAAEQEQNAAELLSETVADRAEMLVQMMQNTEQKLTEYSQAEEITALLQDPNNQSLTEKAQKMTEDFTAEIEDAEGIYVADYNTRLLAHSMKQVVGMITRSDQAVLQDFHDALETANGGIYNAGIQVSPATGTPIISMYQEISDNGKQLGFTGIGVKGDKLIAADQGLFIEGIQDSVYSLIDTDRQKYICDGISGESGTDVTNDDLLAVCSGKNPEKNGTLSVLRDGQRCLTAYCFVPEYHTLLLLDASVS